MAYLVVVGTGFLAESARAADRYWVTESGLWSQSINWSPAAVPGPADNAVVSAFFGLSRINTTAIGSVASVSIYNSASVTISNQGSLLCAGDFVVGQYNGAAGAASTGALNVRTNDPNVAFPGGLMVNGNLRLGVRGTGSVIQDAGTVRVANQVNVGELPATQSVGEGSYTLTGTGLLVAKHLRVGAESNLNTLGTFNLSGFANANVEELSVGPGRATVHQTAGRMSISGVLSIRSLLSTVGGSYNLSGGTLASAYTYINDAGFNYTGGNASLGNLSISGSGSIHLSGGGDKVLRAEQIMLSGFQTRLDLSDNSMLLADAEVHSLRSVLWLAHQGGSWTGPGITSSFAYATALLNLPHRTALGYGPVAEGTLITYTYVGDATLDGAVNLQDFNRLASSFGATSAFWHQGDFNYDGSVNLQDFNALAANFGLSAAGTTVSPHDWAALASAVPEPSASSAAAALLALPFLQHRRSRRTRRSARRTVAAITAPAV